MDLINVEGDEAFDVEVLPNNFGDETFVEIEYITYHPYRDVLVIDIIDADAIDGFYQMTYRCDGWNRQGQVRVVDGSSVGCPGLSRARELSEEDGSERMIEVIANHPEFEVIEDAN